MADYRGGVCQIIWFDGMMMKNEKIEAFTKLKHFEIVVLLVFNTCAITIRVVVHI